MLFKVFMKHFFTVLMCFSLLEISGQKLYLPVQEKPQLLDTVNDLRENFINKLSARDTSLIPLLNTQIVYKTKDTIEFFFPTERAMSLFLVHAYRILLADVNNYVDFHSNDIPRNINWKKKEYNYSTLGGFVPPVDTSIVKELVKDSAAIKFDIQQSSLQQLEKDFLYLYLQSILSYNDLEHFDTEAMNIKADTYIAAYKESPYINYVDTVLNIKLETKKVGIGAGFSTGCNIVDGSFSNYL